MKIKVNTINTIINIVIVMILISMVVSIFTDGTPFRISWITAYSLMWVLIVLLHIKDKQPLSKEDKEELLAIIEQKKGEQHGESNGN